MTDLLWETDFFQMSHPHHPLPGYHAHGRTSIAPYYLQRESEQWAHTLRAQMIHLLRGDYIFSMKA